MVTRGDIQGALKVLNATNTKGRKAALQAMLSKEHSAKDVAKALTDLSSYPEWGTRMDLEETPVAAVTTPSKARKSKG